MISTKLSIKKYDGSGNSIVGATSATYIVTNVTFAVTGSYYVVVSNSLGSVTSAVAVINVVATPTFIGYTTFPPTLNTIPISNGSAFSITANVTGGSIDYQWQKGGVDILGETSATYSDASATLSDSGVYRIKYKNPVNPVFTPAPSATPFATPSNTPTATFNATPTPTSKQEPTQKPQ